MSAKLKPCPFCGGAVELERTTGQFERFHGGRKWWGVICRNAINLGGTCAIQQVPSASEDAAVERWNRRALAAAADATPLGYVNNKPVFVGAELEQRVRDGWVRHNAQESWRGLPIDWENDMRWASSSAPTAAQSVRDAAQPIDAVNDALESAPAPSEQSAHAGSACQGGNTKLDFTNYSAEVISTNNTAHAQIPVQPAAAPAPTDAGIPISDEKLIADALEIAHDLAIEQQAEYAVRYEGYKPDRHAAAARDVATAKAALAAWQARGQQQAGVAVGCVKCPRDPAKRCDYCGLFPIGEA